MKYWEILLMQHKARGGEGLTLPYLIGAQNHLPLNYNPQKIEDLILEMIIKNSFETCIRLCVSTKTLIFEVRKEKNSVYYPSYNDTEQFGLSVALFHKQELCEKIEDLIEILKDKYQTPIENNLFSAVPNVDGREPIWMPFSNEEDIPFIKMCYSILNIK